MRAKKPHDFPDTRPLPLHQERLHAQWGRHRAHYVPNHVPAATRIVNGLLSLTWMTWALIGILSGHMFFLLGLPLHFSGVPALVFSLAVLASAAACSVTIVDHHDKRDNERTYRRAHRVCWAAAAGFFVLAIAIGAAEQAGLLPFTDGRVGLMSTHRLHGLLASEALRSFLLVHPFGQWCGISAAWCVVGVYVFNKMGWLHAETARRDPGALLIVLMSMIIPALATFSLWMLALLAPGEVTGWQAHEEEFRADQAWLLSGLLAGVSATAVCVAVFAVIVLQQLGMLPAPKWPDSARS